MTNAYPALDASRPTSGTEDDDDDRDDEHEGENEALVREVDETAEAPEEFEGDAENKLAHPADDDADRQDNGGRNDRCRRLESATVATRRRNRPTSQLSTWQVPWMDASEYTPSKSLHGEIYHEQRSQQ
jgi:hypothetical protein